LTGAFGEILDASAVSGSSRPEGPKSAAKAGGLDPLAAIGEAAASLPSDVTGQSATSAQVKPASTPALVSDKAPPDAGSPAPLVSPVLAADLAVLAQVIAAVPAGNAPVSAPDGKPVEVKKAAGKTDAGDAETTEASGDALAPIATPDVQAAAIPAGSIVAVLAPATPIESQSAKTSDDSSAGTATAPTTAATSQPAVPVSVGDAPTKETESEKTAAAASGIPPPAAEGDAVSAKAMTQSKPTAAAFANAEATPADTTSSDPSVKAEAKTLRIPDAPEPEAKSPQTKAEAPEADAKSPQTEAKVLKTEAKSPPRDDQQSETSQPSDGKIGRAQAGKANAAPHGKAKPGEPPGAPDQGRAAAQAGEQDSKTPAPAHQPRGEPTEQAAATGRVAVAAAHDNLAAPTSGALAVTAQLGGAPPALGLNLAAPLASPLQSLWQPAPPSGDRSDNAVPIAGVAIEIISRAQDGLRRFEIRLDPPELGRIDVRLDVDSGGNVTSRLTAERAETLDLLRRDAPQLERALQHAGLNTEGGLQFSLRDQSFANRDQTPRSVPTFIMPDDEPAAAEAARRGYGRLIGLGGGIDIRV
jgi:flagellar hook-length control protein FliK